jgi:bifunctional ADP-heptose synthase (sugar kinase/adenylyltransferase)
VPILIDPGRVSNYECYRGASVLAPNRAQAEMSTGQSVKSPDDDAIEVGK